MTTSAPNPPEAFSHPDFGSLGLVLEKAVELSPVLVVVFASTERELVFANGKARQILNPGDRADWSRECPKLSDLIGPSSIDAYQSEIASHLSVLGRWQGRLGLLNACGNEFTVFAVLSRVVPQGDKRYVCLQAVQPEVLLSKRRATATDQDLLNALLNHLPDCVYFKDRAGRFLRASRSLATHSGCADPRELIGHTAFDFLPIARAAVIHEGEQAMLASQTPMLDHEEEEVLPDGRSVWFSTTKLPLHDIEGNLLGTFGVSRNITARKNTEQERRELEMQLQLAHKLESIGMLAAGVAHEINTPTQFITDNTRFLQEAFAQLTAALSRFRALAFETSPASDASHRIAEETELDYYLGEIPATLEQTLDGLGRVSRIVGSLKEFSHPHTFERSPADLNRAIETTLSVARHEWKYVAELETDLDPDLPLVPCVLDEFNQVILNLVINACHAIAEALGPTSSAKGVITVRTRKGADHVWIEVSDTGAGIPPEIRDRIFELFFTTKRADKGTGQGLAFVRNIIVQHHNGTVDFTSEVGRGTTFRIQLPLVLPAEKTA